MAAATRVGSLGRGHLPAAGQYRTLRLLPARPGGPHGATGGEPAVAAGPARTAAAGCQILLIRLGSLLPSSSNKLVNSDGQWLLPFYKIVT